MKKIGFFGGAFNPPTFAHITLANDAYQTCQLDQVVFVPVGNQYQKENLVDETHRFQMLRIACKPYNQFDVSDIELGKGQSYTAIEAFRLIQTAYPEDELYFMMGADNLFQLPEWDQAEELCRDFHFIILERNNQQSSEDFIQNHPLLSQYKSHFQVVPNNTHREVSSKMVRQKIFHTQNASELISDDVYQYIDLHHLYQ